jgi:hypothetical protein
MLLLASLAQAATVGGYFRLMARPDLVGGDGRLGTSAFYGRLLNEGPWGLLDVHQSLGDGGVDGASGSLSLRIEGGAVAGGDPSNGSLLGFRLSQLHLDATHVAGLDWRVGTLECTFGDLWLYDTRPTQMLVDVLGVSTTWKRGGTTATFGLGDAGWTLHGARYHIVASAGGSMVHTAGPFTVGLGGQAWYEPADGDPDALRSTEGLDVDAWYGDRDAWARLHPDNAVLPARPVSGRGWKLAAHAGVGKVGIVHDARVQVVWQHRLPDGPATVTVDDTPVSIGAADHTDGREELVVGAQVDLALVPDHLELAWGALLDVLHDADDPTNLTLGNRRGLSTVGRGQLALTRHVSLLAETSVAHEVARGRPARRTWQGKGGLVLSPAGTGLDARPAIRLLGGVQRSSEPDAWPGTPTGSHWHALVSLEGEAWF